MTRTIAIGYEQNLAVDSVDLFVKREVRVPELGERDLLVEVHAVSVNPVDTKIRANRPADGFRVLGFDAAGVVREVGSAVEYFSPGDTVFYAGDISKPGSNQQLQAIDERLVGRKPTSLSYAEAASVPLVALTAWESLFEHLKVFEHSEGTLLVVGATGGVGSILLKLANVLLPHVRVIATASSPERQQWVLHAGADDVVNHHANLGEEVLQLAPEGVDWIFTAFSVGQLETYATVLKPFGHVVAIDGPAVDVAPLKEKSISWHWEYMFTKALFPGANFNEQHEILDRVAELFDAGKLSPVPLEVLSPISAKNLREAHAVVEEGRTLGKVVLEGWENS